MPTKCDRCGAETNTAELFFKERDSFRSTVRTFCPPCWQERTVSNYQRVLICQLAPGLFGLGLLLFFPDSSTGRMFINLFLFQFFMLCTILPHEYAHATAARLMGMRVFKVIIGMGKTLFSRKLFGFETEFKTVPAGGLAIAAPITREWFRLKQFAFIVAGPLVNLLLAAIVYPFVSGELWSMSALDQQIAPGLAFFYANLVVLIYNLWPHDVTTSLGKSPSDGKLLLKTFFIKPAAVEEQLAACFVFDAAVACDKGDYTNARRVVEQGLCRHPGNFHLLNWLSTLLLRFHEFPQSRAISLKILAESEKDPFNHALILNNIAYVDALIGDPALLAEADQFSDKAMTTLAWHPAIKGTRGTVLVELGRIEEGIALLKESMASHVEVQHKAENACYLAIAEALRGDFAAGRQYLDEARQLDPTCYLLEKAETRLKTLA